MLKVSGLPIRITKSELDELFSPYGTIQVAEDSPVIEVKGSESIAYISLDQNESEAIQALSNTVWRGTNLLYLDPIRGERRLGQIGSGGQGNRESDTQESGTQGNDTQRSDSRRNDEIKGAKNR